MGQLTRGQIVTEGMRLAGRLDVTTSANIWLNSWLRSTYRSWTWPFLHRRERDISLPAATTSLSFGIGTPALEVQHIFDPVRVYTANKSLKGMARVRQYNNSLLFTDEDMTDWTNQTASRGLPYAIHLFPDTALWGKWTLKFFPVPDIDYKLTVDYLVQPADISSDATVPLYPNDETMIQAVKTATLDFMHESDKYQLAYSILNEMRGSDKIKYGMAQGINDHDQLDGSVFRQRTDVIDWWKL